MRKFYITLGCSLALLPAIAQDPQLPNSGFEEPFVDCIPWTSTDNTKTTGTTPENWTISQVVGIIALGGMGATEVGGMVEGYESTQAVTVYNKPNSAAAMIGMKQIVPGYVTLGTTWSTSIMGKENDGGTFGGIDFTGRPTEITFMYKRELGEEGNTQPATVVVYLWKGTYTQKDVPGDIPLGKPTLVDMVNRDRNILGIETAKGGEVTESDDAELIGRAIVKIEDVTSEWKQGKVTIEYLSDATPEHINVIFAANDYFGDAADIEAGNSLTIDNVYCVYGDTENTGEEYNGQLEVEMNGGSLTDEPVNTSIFITENTDGTFTFLLPNLTLGDIGSVGDIKLDGVTRTTTDGVDT
ncbi:MAG: calycin-like domain-containing protein, partial [Candidatus Amulumruptor sp.]|nr:calycin-like domain-containing protein [Candidatus Amulumruptor sp.]